MSKKNTHTYVDFNTAICTLIDTIDLKSVNYMPAQYLHIQQIILLRPAYQKNEPFISLKLMINTKDN